MKIEYFKDTDTIYMTLSTKTPVETREINENVYVDLDAVGGVVSITIEHAKDAADITNLVISSLPQIAA